MSLRAVRRLSKQYRSLGLVQISRYSLRRTKMRLSRFTLLMLTLLVLHAPSAFADPITFTHQGVGSGTINGTPFSSTSYIITAVGNTSNRQPFVGGFSIDHESAMISITGVGTFTFTLGTRAFVNNSIQ